MGLSYPRTLTKRRMKARRSQKLGSVRHYGRIRPPSVRGRCDVPLSSGDRTGESDLERIELTPTGGSPMWRAIRIQGSSVIRGGFLFVPGEQLACRELLQLRLNQLTVLLHHRCESRMPRRPADYVFQDCCRCEESSHVDVAVRLSESQKLTRGSPALTHQVDRECEIALAAWDEIGADVSEGSISQCFRVHLEASAISTFESFGDLLPDTAANEFCI